MQSEAQLQQTIVKLMQSQPNDQRLSDHLEGLLLDPSFAGLTWFWGPLLYQRNRVVFRNLIFTHFSTASFTGLRVKRIKWSAHADGLQAWLDLAKTNRDTPLVRRLMRWKFASKDGWNIDPVPWNAALLAAYRAATAAAGRAAVLDEFEGWFELDEQTACGMYAIDRRSSKFILQHLPQTFWGDEKRKHWHSLSALAKEANDHLLVEELYRRQVPIKEWSAYVLHLASQDSDAATLCEQLERHHPQGYALKIHDTILRLLELRGRDVIPYVRKKLSDLNYGWLSNSTKSLVALASQRGWWDLWAAAIRASRDDKPFNAAVEELLNDHTISEEERLSRLGALAGVSREWNWSGFGFAVIHSLRDELAVKLYSRYPQLIHGGYKPNITPTWWQGFPELLKAAIRAEDHQLIDLLASRYVTRSTHQYAWSGTNAKLIDTAGELCDYYDALRSRDPAAFALRAANVLTRIPAYAISRMRDLLETNKLARLLFVRSFEHYLEQPQAVRDLVEGSDIHVQMLAYRILARDDDRARQQAVQCADILIGTLLRPLHRKTRLAAFAALVNAARGDATCAQRLLGRAREALRLPDQRYPKEELVGLIGAILHHCPQLRSAREQPVVYGLTEATT